LTFELEFNTITTTCTDQRQSTSSTLLNYLGHVRHVNLPQFTFIECDAAGRMKNTDDYPPQLLSYILGQDMMDMYLADRKDAYCSIHGNKPSDQLPPHIMQVSSTGKQSGPLPPRFSTNWNP
jgi:hypothetical protein